MKIRTRDRVRHRAGGLPHDAQEGTVTGEAFTAAVARVAVRWDGMGTYDRTWHSVSELVVVPVEEVPAR